MTDLEIKLTPSVEILLLSSQIQGTLHSLEKTASCPLFFKVLLATSDEDNWGVSKDWGTNPPGLVSTQTSLDFVPYGCHILGLGNAFLPRE